MSFFHLKSQTDKASPTQKLRGKADQTAASLPALMACAEKNVADILQGEHALRKHGAGETFWQFRDYTPFDRPQDINWRQSAKSDQITITQKEHQTTQNALFWCHRGKSMDFSSPRARHSKGDCAKILTLSLALLMIRTGEKVGLLGDSRKGRSSATIDHMEERLTAPQSTEPQSLAELSHVPFAAHSFLTQISDFLEPLPAIERCFESLSARSNNGLVIQILDPDERDLPYKGRVLFENPHDQNQELISHVCDIRTAYQKRLNGHIQSVQELCALSGWHYILHSTDTPLQDTLFEIHALLSPEGRQS